MGKAGVGERGRFAGTGRKREGGVFRADAAGGWAGGWLVRSSPFLANAANGEVDRPSGRDGGVLALPHYPSDLPSAAHLPICTT